MSRSQWPPRVLFHKSSGQDRIRVNGRDYYLGPHGSEESRRRYAELVSQLARDGQAGPGCKRSTGPPAFTVADLVERWRREERPRLPPRGREAGQFDLCLSPLLRLYADLPAASFGTLELEAYRDALASGSWLTDADRAAHPRRPREGGWSRVTVNHAVVRTRRVFRWAERQRLVAPGTWHTLRTVPGLRRGLPGVRDQPRRRPATLDEVKRVTRGMPAAAAAALLLQWWTGCRSAEARSVRAGDVDTSAAVWLYRPRQHKTDYLGDTRVIALGPRARAVLRPWLARALAAGPDAAVFPAPGGQPYSLAGYSQAVRRGARAAGLPPDWSAYGCRHAARMRFGAAAGDEAARAALGHRTASTTERYGELDVRLAAEAARRCG